MLLLICGCVLAGFLVSTSVTAAMRKLAPRWGLLDKPNARKVHSRPIALGGGIGILLGVVVPLVVVQLAALWFGDSQVDWLPADLAPHLRGVALRTGQLWSIVAAGIVISALGLLDDTVQLGWKPKLLVQFLVAGGLVAAGVRATFFLGIPGLEAVLSMLWIVTLINSLNFLDNMDGLSAGIGLIVATIFSMIMLFGTSQPHWFVAGFLLILVGSLGGFLVHNWPPAKIFMGDTGSCLIGLWLACLTLVGTFYDYRQGNQHVILAPLCVLAVPLYDFCSVVLIRLRQGRSPFHADKSHFSHRLVEMGLTKKHAVKTIYLVTLTTGLGGLLLYRVPGWPGAAMVVALIGCVLAVIAILETAGRSGRNE